MIESKISNKNLEFLYQIDTLEKFIRYYNTDCKTLFDKIINSIKNSYITEIDLLKTKLHKTEKEYLKFKGDTTSSALRLVESKQKQMDNNIRN
jgi:hypothetical protein